MIAPVNSFYDTRGRRFPGPAMVREPMGVRLDANPAPSGPEPSGDDDELRKLGERIAELAARINSAEARMMTLIAEFDRRGGWKDGGYSSCAEWLAWRTGTRIGTARERVRTTFSVFVDGDGMYVVKGRLEPEVGATPEREAELLMRAVEAASDALFRREGDARDAAGSGRGVSCEAGDARPEPKQRRADAVGLLAERALAAGFGVAPGHDAHRRIKSSDAPETPSVDEERASPNGEGQASPNSEGQASPNGEGQTSSHGDPSTASRVGSGTRAERYQVMVHCDAATLAAEGEPGRSELDGIRVSAETSRRMACDAAVVAMVHAKDGSMLNVGRRTRTIPPHIRRALEERDRGCRFPGCGCRFTEAHHVKHWADGGETSLRNTLLLCRRHHRAVHEGRVKVSVNGDGTVLFFTPKGRMLVDAPSSSSAELRVRARTRPCPDLPPVPSVHHGAPAETSVASLPVPAAHPSAPRVGGDARSPTERRSIAIRAIPWAIEAAAREAMEDSLES